MPSCLACMAAARHQLPPWRLPQLLMFYTDIFTFNREDDDDATTAADDAECVDDADATKVHAAVVVSIVMFVTTVVSFAATMPLPSFFSIINAIIR